MSARTSACSSGTTTVSTGRARATTTSRRAKLGSNGGIALSGDGKRLAVGDTNGTRSVRHRVSLERDVTARGISSATTLEDDIRSERRRGRSGTPSRSRAMATRLAVGRAGRVAASPESFKRDAAKASWSRMGVDIRGPPTTPTQGSDSSSAGTLDVSGLGAVVSRLSLDGNAARRRRHRARASRERTNGTAPRARWSRMGGDLTAGTGRGRGGRTDRPFRRRFPRRDSRSRR